VWLHLSVDDFPMGISHFREKVGRYNAAPIPLQYLDPFN